MANENKKIIVKENYIINNNQKQQTSKKGGKISSVLPSAKQMLSIFLILPIIVFAICIAFDLNNITYFKEIQTTYGTTMYIYDVKGYLQGLDNAGQTLKAIFVNLGINEFLPSTWNEIPTYDPTTQQNFWTIITQVGKNILNILIMIVNLLSMFINTGIGVFMSIGGLLQVFIALIGLNSADGTILGAFTKIITFLSTTIHIPMIPYIS